MIRHPFVTRPVHYIQQPIVAGVLSLGRYGKRSNEHVADTSLE